MNEFTRARTLIIIAAVCCIAAVVHWPALSAKAMSFDDQQYLSKNILVQNPSFKSAGRFLTEVLEPSTVAGYYQPLAMISLMLDCAMGGSDENLTPFHITSLVLHTANTALVIVLLYLLFGNIWAAAAAGLLFAVHPMTVEPIPWVAERKTLLAAFFSFWSLIFYISFARTGKKKSFAGCFVMYLFALLSKPTSVALPLVMLLIDYWPLRRLSKKTILEKIPLFGLSFLFAIITYVSQQRTCIAVAPADIGMGRIFLIICHNIVFYLYKIIAATNLSSHYAFPRPINLSVSAYLVGVIGTVILIPLLLISLRWTRAVITGWLIFFVAIFPTLGVVGFTNVIASDKYVYLPAIGFLMIVTTFLLLSGKNKKTKIILVAVVLTLAAAESGTTRHYLAYWQDSIILTNHMIALAPDSAPLFNDRGLANVRLEKYDLAFSDFSKAVELNPKYFEAYHNLGIMYTTQGQNDKAIAEYNKSLQINPKYIKALESRGRIFFARGQFDAALADYNNAIKINPEFVDAVNSRGNLFEKKGQFDLALADFNRAVSINPKYFYSYHNRANIYMSRGDFAKAISDYDKAIRLNPKFADAYNNRGNSFRRLGKYDLAVSDFDNALKANPNYIDAWFNKAAACESAARKKEAIEAYKMFIKSAPANRARQIELAKQKIKQLEQ